MDSHQGITVGLFGTCDNSKWREPFIKKYEEMGIKFFNPDIPDWMERLEASRRGECENPTVEENYYLNNAEIILFPILSESLGSGSLGELGFSIKAVMRNISNGKRQFLIGLIDDECTDMRKTDEERKRSTKDRALVKSKFKESVCCPIITLVETIDDMIQMSLEVYNILAEGCPEEEQAKTGTNDK